MRENSLLDFLNFILLGLLIVAYSLGLIRLFFSLLPSFVCQSLGLYQVDNPSDASRGSLSDAISPTDPVGIVEEFASCFCKA